MKALALALAAVLLASSALADQRGYSVTSFTRMRVEGAVTVVVKTGGSPGGRAEGDRQAIDKIQLENSGDQLNVRIDRNNWTGSPSSQGNGRGTLYVTTPGLSTLYVVGAGNVDIDHVRGPKFTMVLTGSGSASIADLKVEQLNVGVNGAGSAKIAGQAKQAHIESQGVGNIDAAAVTADDSDVTLLGAGEIRLTTSRSAKNVLKGQGSIVIEGNPACTGTSEGSGEVVCGGSPK